VEYAGSFSESKKRVSRRKRQHVRRLASEIALLEVFAHKTLIQWTVA
jgi:hypothetical protein